MPKAKHIQMELSWESSIGEAGAEKAAQVAILVQRRDSKSGAWKTLGEYRQPEKYDPRYGGVSDIHLAGYERVQSGSMIQDLSEYAGMDVRLILEMRFDSKAGQENEARWYKARLVHADFKVRIGDQIGAPDTPGGVPAVASAKINLTTELIGSEEYFDFPGLPHFNGECFTVEYFNDRYIGYMNGGFKSAYAIDLNGLGSFHVTSVTDINARLVYKDQYGDPAYGVNPPQYPWQVLYPIDEETYELDNLYSGISGVIKASYWAGTFLHAVLHCEDKCFNNQWKTASMFRVGYARSNFDQDNLDDAYYFTRLTHDGDSSVPNFPCPERGGWGSAIITADYTEAQRWSWAEAPDGDGSWPLNNNPHNGGCSTPQIIKSGSYYYCFYTYWATPDKQYFWDLGFQEEGDFEDDIEYGVGIARAATSYLDVPFNQYEMEDNPWMIYDNRNGGGFITPGFNDGSGAVQPGDGIHSIPDEDLINMAGPRVSWHNGIEKWFMIAEGDDGTGTSGNVIFTSDDLINWDQGLTIFHWQTGTYWYKNFYCVFVHNTDKEFTKDSHIYYLKATNDPSYTHENNLHRWAIEVDE